LDYIGIARGRRADNLSKAPATRFIVPLRRSLRGGPGASLAGIASALFVVVAIVAAGVASLRAPWARIGVRVRGSWIAAGGLLLLGWTLGGFA
jgi:hypothetical protein